MTKPKSTAKKSTVQVIRKTDPRSWVGKIVGYCCRPEVFEEIRKDGSTWYKLRFYNTRFHTYEWVSESMFCPGLPEYEFIAGSYGLHVMLSPGLEAWTKAIASNLNAAVCSVDLLLQWAEQRLMELQSFDRIHRLAVTRVK